MQEYKKEMIQKAQENIEEAKPFLQLGNKTSYIKALGYLHLAVGYYHKAGDKKNEKSVLATVEKVRKAKSIIAAKEYIEEARRDAKNAPVYLKKAEWHYSEAGKPELYEKAVRSLEKKPATAGTRKKLESSFA